MQCKSAFQTLGKENSWVMTVWVWVYVYCLILGVRRPPARSMLCCGWGGEGCSDPRICSFFILCFLGLKGSLTQGGADSQIWTKHQTDIPCNTQCFARISSSKPGGHFMNWSQIQSHQKGSGSNPGISRTDAELWKQLGREKLQWNLHE